MYLLLEIIFEISNHEKLRSFFQKIVTFNNNAIIRSHFYDDANKRDVEYEDIDDYCSFILSNGTESSLFLSSVNCGVEFEEAGILVAHDSQGVVISLSIEKDSFAPSIEECTLLIQHLSSSISSSIVDNIIIGYDPAEDIDMQIITLRKYEYCDIDIESKKLYAELNSLF